MSVRDPEPQTKYSETGLHRRLLLLARPYWPQLAGLLGLSLLAAPLALLAPLPLRVAVDCVIGTRPLPAYLDPIVPPVARGPGGLLVVTLALLIGVSALRQGIELGTLVLGAYVRERLTLDLRALLFRQAQRLSVSHHDLRGTSDSAYRIQYDTPAAQTVATEGVIPFVASSVTIVSMVIATARIDAPLAIVSLAICPILLFVSHSYRRRFRSRWRDLKLLETSALSVVQEALGAIRVVKAFGQEEREQQRFVRRSGDGVWARVQLAAAEGGFALQIGLVTALGTAGVLFVGVGHVRSGALTLGQLLMVMAYLSQLYEPLRTMSKKAASLQGSLASAERVFTLLDSATDVEERPNARPVSRARGRVTFGDVSFAYDSGRPILRNVTFDLAPGMRLGLSGTTGTGKTTLVGLLTRFHDPTSGTILLDGVDLRDYRLADLRNQFGIVLQEPVLFSTSIAENIAYARPKATEAEIVAAARAARAHDFIQALPEGYQTRVGERGARLSGGERQRISIARAFLRDAPILILDEPTSSVDVQTELEIMTALERLMDGRTAIIVAHRLSTLEGCDVRVAIEDGRVVNLASPEAGARAS